MRGRDRLRDVLTRRMNGAGFAMATDTELATDASICLRSATTHLAEMCASEGLVIERRRAMPSIYRWLSGAPAQVESASNFARKSARTSAPLARVEDLFPSPLPKEKARKTRARVQAPEPEGFAQFWEAYPRKQSKGQARRAYAQALANGHNPQAILEGVRRYRFNPPGETFKFNKHPATWLNAECWMDEQAPKAAPPPPKAWGLWR